MSVSPFLNFCLPDLGEEEIQAVSAVLRSGWITTGPYTRQFEHAFAAYIEQQKTTKRQALAVNSATAGLHLALEAIGLSAGDEVITTTFTFTATAEVVRYLGAHPVFIDIDPATLNLDAQQIERAITAKTKAILPVHFAGLACDMAAILEVADKYDLRVIEDAAHALPTTYRGQRIGQLASDATVFSFYATKTITTGEGGMILTQNEEIAERCKTMRLHGISRDAFNRYTSTLPAWYYEVVAPGFKYNLTDIASAIGLEQLKKADTFQRKRQVLADRYSEALQNLPVVLPPRPLEGDMHAWHLYVLRLMPKAPLQRDALIARMAVLGIGCSVHFIPLHMQPYWRDTYQLKPMDFPVALQSFEQALSLPLYTKMTEDDQQRVIDALQTVLG